MQSYLDKDYTFLCERLHAISEDVLVTWLSYERWLSVCDVIFLFQNVVF